MSDKQLSPRFEVVLRRSVDGSLLEKPERIVSRTTEMSTDKEKRADAANFADAAFLAASKNIAMAQLPLAEDVFFCMEEETDVAEADAFM